MATSTFSSASASRLRPRSYLLENDGTGRFRDVTEDAASELAKTSVVTDAV